MKILFSSLGLLDAPNGAFLRSYYFAKELSNKHEVTLITLQKKGYVFPYKKIIRDGILIIAFPSIMPVKIKKFGYGILSLFLRVLYVLRNKYDIVFSDNHRPASSLPCIIHRYFYRSKYISEWQDYLGKNGQYDNKPIIWKLTLGTLDNFLEKYMRKISDGVVVLSEFLYENAIVLGQHINNIILVWGGSDIDGINFYRSNNVKRKKFHFPEEKFIFIAVGMDGLEILEYQHFFKVLNTIYENKRNFIFIRTGNPINPEIRKKLNIGSYFHEVGFLSYLDYQDFLSCANAFVLMQHNNKKNIGRWPNCIGDYLAAGRPIIYNIVGELRKFQVICKEGSLVVDSQKFSLFLKQIEYILNNNQLNDTKYEKIRKWAENNFSWKYRAEQLDKFFMKFF